MQIEAEPCANCGERPNDPDRWECDNCGVELCDMCVAAWPNGDFCEGCAEEHGRDEHEGSDT